MVTNRATNQQQTRTVNIGGQEFEQVEEFQYLGALVQAAADTTDEIKRRVMSANRCFYGQYYYMGAKHGQQQGVTNSYF